MSLKPGQVGGILGEKSSVDSRFDKLVTAILIIAKLSGGMYMKLSTKNSISSSLSTLYTRSTIKPLEDNYKNLKKKREGTPFVSVSPLDVTTTDAKCRRLWRCCRLPPN